MKHNNSIELIEKSAKAKNAISLRDINKQLNIPEKTPYENHKSEYYKDFQAYYTKVIDTKSKNKEKNYAKQLQEETDKIGENIRNADKYLSELEYLFKAIKEENENIGKSKVVGGEGEDTNKNENENEDDNNIDFVEKLIDKIDLINIKDEPVYEEANKYEKQLKEIVNKPDDNHNNDNDYVNIDLGEYKNETNKKKSRKIKLDDNSDGNTLITLYEQVKSFFKDSFSSNFKKTKVENITDIEKDVTTLIGMIKKKQVIIGKSIVNSQVEELKKLIKNVKKLFTDHIQNYEKLIGNMMKYLERETGKFKNKLEREKRNEEKRMNDRSRNDYNNRGMTDKQQIEKYIRDTKKEINDKINAIFRENTIILKKLEYTNTAGNIDTFDTLDKLKDEILKDITSSAKIDLDSIKSKDKADEINRQIDENIDKLQEKINAEKTKQAAENNENEGSTSTNNSDVKSDNNSINELEKAVETLKKKIEDIKGIFKRISKKGNYGVGNIPGNISLGDDIFKLILEDYEQKKSEATTFEQKIKVDADFLKKVDSYGLNVFEIFKPTQTDKLYFLMLIMIVQLISFTIVELLIENDWLDNLLSSIATYGILYSILMGIIIYGVNNVGFKFKLILNYLNTDFNMSQIIVHFAIIGVFLLIIGIVSLKIKTYSVSEKDYDEKLKLIYRIDMISTIITIFSGIFVFLL